MDGGGKKIESICKYVPSLYRDYHKISESYHKEKQRYGSNPYMCDATEQSCPYVSVANYHACNQ